MGILESEYMNVARHLHNSRRSSMATLKRKLRLVWNLRTHIST